MPAILMILYTRHQISYKRGLMNDWWELPKYIHIIYSKHWRVLMRLFCRIVASPIETYWTYTDLTFKFTCNTFRETIFYISCLIVRTVGRSSMWYGCLPFCKLLRSLPLSEINTLVSHNNHASWAITWYCMLSIYAPYKLMYH